MIGQTNAIEQKRKMTIDEHTLFLLTDTIEDLSNFHTEIVNNNVVISNAVQRDGRNSLNFNGSNAKLILNKLDYIRGSNPFTVECWLYINQAKVFGIFQQKTSNNSNQYGCSCYFSNNNGPRLLLSNNTSSWNIRDTSNSKFYQLSSWAHVAFTRDDQNQFKVFYNGVIVESFSSTAALSSVQTQYPQIGIYQNTDGSYYFNGYLQDFRISNIARYTAAFTPPQRLI